MEFHSYQQEAAKTIQKHPGEEQVAHIIPFLGIIGEIGSVVTQLKKKFRDGDAYVAYKTKLAEELGDVLWYIAAIATQDELDMEEIAKSNLAKIHDRFLADDPGAFTDFDAAYPEQERFPDEFEIEFIGFDDNGKKKLKIIDKRDGSLIGDPLTDNTYEDDGYRYHDIFHYGYLAILGWSPVIRKLLSRKRKSQPDTDENEDGARAQITEELVSLFIYRHAVDHDLLKYSSSVDSGIIKNVQNLVSKSEVSKCSGKQWEKAILDSYEIFNKLRANNGGRVMVSKKNRSLLYLGKN